MRTNRSDETVLGDALNETKRFVYANGAELTVISVCWFVCSLPIVTLGVTTLGAYTGIASLRDGEGIHVERVIDTVRRNIIGATLLGLFPMILVGVSALYLVQYLAEGTVVAGLFALVGAYATVFAVLVLIPSFVSLAQGTTVTEALRDGYLWTAHHPTLVLVMGLVTLVILGVTLLLLVAFVLVFAGVAFSFHTLVIEPYLTPESNAKQL